MEDYEILISTEGTAINGGPENLDEGARVRTDGEGDDERGDVAAIREEVPESLSRFTLDEWKRIQRFAATAEDDRDPDLLVPEEDPIGTATHSGATNPVTAERCRRIRRRMRNATTVREVIGEFPKLHRSEIFRHAYGDCGHAHDTPPTASPQIRRGECHAMREEFVEGGTVSEIGDAWHRAENTTNRHIFGRCSHATNPRPLSPSQVPECEVARITRTIRENSQVGVEEVAAAMRLRPEVVATVRAFSTRDG